MNGLTKLNCLLGLMLCSAASVQGQFDTRLNIIYSKNVSDSFEIYTSLPLSYNKAYKYNVVYYCDANLKSGKFLRETIVAAKTENLKRTIFIGIGHIGNYHVLRRRDFILPAIKGSDTIGRDKNYGQTEKFYAFLKTELIPSVNSRYSANVDSNSILGHSLGGLFAFYCLFKSDNLFTKYFALSPALWIDKYSIYKFNSIHGGFNQKKYLYFSAGSKETINRILKGTSEAELFLKQKNYNNLSFDYDVWKRQTHNSQVAFSLTRIINEGL